MEIKYYDERYYLSRFGVSERKLLEYWKEKNKSDNEVEMAKYSSLISDYDSYILLVSKLINEISLDNSVSKGLIISVLVQAGAFSYDQYKYSNKEDILNSRLGLNVLKGECCCRNVSSFMTNIFKVNNEFCENLAVISLDKKDKRKAVREMANHMINLISYDGVLYGFDSLSGFGSLYYFINSFELLPIESSKNAYMHYKPYIDYVYNNLTFEDIKQKLLAFKENGKTRISEKEFNDLVVETDIKLSSNISLVEDFMKDTNREITHIKEKIKAMKK